MLSLLVRSFSIIFFTSACCIFINFHSTSYALKIYCAPSRQRRSLPHKHTNLHALDNNNKWWDGSSSNIFGGKTTENERQSIQYDDDVPPPSLITREMEEEVLTSARATLDSNTVSRAISSLIIDDNNVQSEKKNSNSLRDLATRNNNNNNNNDIIQQNSNISTEKSNNAFDTQQIAIASGATTFLLSPIIVPIIHSLLPPIIPSPSSISVTGAALLGTLSYIVALGDPTEQSMGEGVEVGGAVSRIVGRTALQSTEVAAPRIKAAARAIVDYDSTTATLEEVEQLSQTVLKLETENDELRREVALFNAVEDVSNMYKYEDLKEMARYRNLKGYSVGGKNALLRRLIREDIIKLDLGPYY